MIDLGFVGLLTVWSIGVGLGILDRLRIRSESTIDSLALATPLGLGTLSLAALSLGELGWLHAGGLAVVLLAGGVLGARPLWEMGRRLGVVRSSSIPLEAPDLALLVCLMLTIVGTFLTALAPVTDGDALCYHLQVPKLFLAQGSVGFEPDLHETIYPLQTEMLYAVALAFRGPVACRLVQWLLGLTFALNTSCVARPWLGVRAWWAGAVVMLVPAVSNGMTAPLNDVCLAAYGSAALLALSRYLVAPSTRSAILTGMLCGLAAGVKYPALVLVGLIGMSLLIPQPGRLRHALAFSVTVALVGGCWYMRAYLQTGNPVYPFFRQVFGGSGLDEVLAPEKRPMVVNLWNLLTALKPLTLEPDRFDSLSHQFGPAFLLFLPALLYSRPPRRVLGLVAIGQAFLMICLTQRQSMRFLLIALGPLSVGVAWLARSWWERRSAPGRLLVGLLLSVLAFESAVSLARARHALGVVFGRESAGSYLARREPTYIVGQWVGGHLAPDARIIGQDHRGYYFPRDYTMELAHRRRTGLGRNGETPQQILNHFDREGFTHILLCPPEPETAVEFDPTLGRILRPWLAAQTPLYQERLTDADRVPRLYSLYALPESRQAGRDATRIRR
jgi:hypothetical protein